MRLRNALPLILALILVPLAAEAHRASDSYLTLKVEDVSISGRWDLALRDLEHAIGLDGNDDGAVTWGELHARYAAVAAYALARLTLSTDGARCSLRATDHLVERHGNDAYAVLEFAGDCPTSGGIRDLRLSYGLFFDLDPQHRGLLRLERGDTTVSAIFSPDSAVQDFAFGEPAPWRMFADFFGEGIHHIWIGLDHVLFLLTLLLPAALMRQDGRWVPVARLRTALGRVLTIVTAFTLAHSITLGLAALELVTLPSRLVESVIAASVVVAAINIIRPIITRRLWLVVLGFGLIHGFGFAGVLADLGLPSQSLAVALFAFNLGVEAGQLAIVATILPIAYLLRGRVIYTRLALPAGALLVAAIGTVWMLERAFAQPAGAPLW